MKICYKGKVYPRSENIKTLCHWNNVTYNLFEKCYKDTHKVVEVEVSSSSSPPKTEKAKETGLQQKEEAVREVRILVDLRVSNGLHLQQGNLSYANLKCLVEKLDGSMLTSVNWAGFYYLSNFHDLRCKYARSCPSFVYKWTGDDYADINRDELIKLIVYLREHPEEMEAPRKKEREDSAERISVLTSEMSVLNRKAGELTGISQASYVSASETARQISELLKQLGEKDRKIAELKVRFMY